jgi:hypothetical protein
MRIFFGLLPPVVLFAATGCVLDKPVVSPRFAEVRPQRIAVAPVENRTYLDLSKESTLGAAQRLIFGARGVDVPAVLREGLVEALTKKGYDVRLVEPPASEECRGSLPDGQERPYDAVLFAGIDRWYNSASSMGGEIELSGDVQLIRTGDRSRGGGEVLFKSAIYERTGGPSGGGNTTVDLYDEVFRTGRGSLSGLPKKDEIPAAARAPAPPNGSPPPASTSGPPAAGAPGSPAPGPNSDAGAGSPAGSAR